MSELLFNKKTKFKWMNFLIISFVFALAVILAGSSTAYAKAFEFPADVTESERALWIKISTEVLDARDNKSLSEKEKQEIFDEIRNNPDEASEKLNNRTQYRESINEMDKPYEKFAYNMCTAEMVNTSNVGGILQNFEAWGLSDIMENLYGVIKLVGAALLVTYFLLELMDKASRELLDFEAFVRLYLKFIIAKMLILDNGILIIKAMVKIGIGLQTAVNGSAGLPLEIKTQIAQLIQSQNMIMNIILGVLACIPFILKQIIGLVIYAMCFGALIDITIRGAFTPIGCVSMVQEGFSGNGMRYLKKFMGACLQGAVIMGIVFVCGQLSSYIIAASFPQTDDALLNAAVDIVGVLTYLLSSILIFLTELICITKAKQIADDIAGV